MFIVVSCLLFGYSGGRVLTMIHHNEVGKTPWTFAYYFIQMSFEFLCVVVAIWVLRSTGDDDNDKDKDKDKK
jgi:hypothetical protein